MTRTPRTYVIRSQQDVPKISRLSAPQAQRPERAPCCCMAPRRSDLSEQPARLAPCKPGDAQRDDLSPTQTCRETRIHAQSARGSARQPASCETTCTSRDAGERRQHPRERAAGAHAHTTRHGTRQDNGAGGRTHAKLACMHLCGGAFRPRASRLQVAVATVHLAAEAPVWRCRRGGGLVAQRRSKVPAWKRGGREVRL